MPFYWKFQTTAFSSTILNIQLGKIKWIHKVLFLFKTSPYQAETELVKDTLFEI